MKMFVRTFCTFVVLAILTPLVNAQNTSTLNPLYTFGNHGDGSIRPGDSIGTSPVTGNDVQISAPGGFGIQPGDSTGGGVISTNGFNMRGLAFDPVSHNLVFVDSHGGQGGVTNNPPNAAIYILNPDSGQIVGALNTNGIFALPSTGIGTFVTAGVADDGVVYVCNQITSTANGFCIYRWDTADPSNGAFGAPAKQAFTNAIVPSERMAQCMAVRGAGTNTQIILGTSSGNGTGTNIFLFTTTDGTNFTAHGIYFAGITTPTFNDGIAFGPTNTFFTKQVGKPLYYMAYDPVNVANPTSQGTIIASYAGSSPNDPLLNLSAIAYNPTNHLLAGLEEIGGVATGGNGKVWLYDAPSPSNHPPAILSSRVYIVNFQKTTAPMGYLAFGLNRLYAHASNNGLLASTVDSVPMAAPSYIWTDYGLDGSAFTRSSDLPAQTRSAAGQAAHFEVFAVPDVTNYQWYSNNVLIAGANSYYLDVPNVTTNMSGIVYRVVASNAAGSSNSVASTLTVVTASQFFHPELIWKVAATNLALSNPTNLITANGGSGAPNERCIAYNALSNQLLVCRGPSAANFKIMVVDVGSGSLANGIGYSYTLKTTGITGGNQVYMVGLACADDGAVYCCTVNATTQTDQSFKVYRWANTDSNTLPVAIFGTNSPAAAYTSPAYNPVADLNGSQMYRYGDALAAHGSGPDTELIVDSQNSSKYAGILRPIDSTMTNWNQTGYLLQNIQGSYGSQAYGTSVGRSLQFGPVMSTPYGDMPTFWQKRYTAAGAPLAGMGYSSGGGLAVLAVANSTAGFYTNGPVGINFSLKLAAAISLNAGSGTGNTASELKLYDVTDLSQAVFLSSQILTVSGSGAHVQNANFISEVLLGQSAQNGTNYIFCLEGNNGLSAYALVGGVTPPPKFLTQPKNLRILEGTSASVLANADQAATLQWFKGTNGPVYTGTNGSAFTFNNASISSAGDYFVIASNLNGMATSTVAHVTIGLTNDNYSLSQIWAANPTNGSVNYVTSTGGANTPNERSFAYNSASNQLIIVSCPPSSTAYNVYAVDATTGAYQYSLNTNGIVHEGNSEVAGSNPIDLVAATATDDGNIYICSSTPNASGGAAADTTKMLHIYRWTNSAPGTPPVLVYQGDPSGTPAGINLRWGDSLTARGTGSGTELYMNSGDGTYGSVLHPVDATLNAFTNSPFFSSAGGGSIGRTVQLYTNNTVFEKRKGNPLFLSSYNTNAQNSTVLAMYDSSSTLGGVTVDASRKLVIGVDFVGTATSPQKPDAVALYDITEPTSPMLIKRYNFAVNQVANNNFICQILQSGNKVWALDANNGLMFLNIVPPASSLTLTITRSGNNVNISWGSNQAILQGATSLVSPNWTDLTTIGATNSVQPATGSYTFYRLRQ